MKKFFRSLFVWESPLSSGVFGMLLLTLHAIVFPLMLPATFLCFAHYGSFWGFLVVVFLILAYLYGIILLTYGFSAILQNGFPQWPKSLLEFGAMVVAFFVPMTAGLLIFLPAAIRRRDKKAIVWSCLAVLFGVNLLLSLYASSLPSYFKQAYFLITLVFFLGAMMMALPGFRLQRRIFVMTGVGIAALIGMEFYTFSLDTRIDRNIAELERRFGIELSEEAFWQREAVREPLSQAPWPLLQEHSDALRDLSRDLTQDGSQLEENRKLIKEFTASIPELMPTIEQWTQNAISPVQHERIEMLSGVLLPDLNLFRSLIRIYATKLQLAAAAGDRDAMLDAIRRMENLNAGLYESQTLIGGLVGIACDATQRSAIAYTLPNPAWTDADLQEFAKRIHERSEINTYWMQRSVGGEFIMFRNLMRTIFKPDTDSEFWKPVLPNKNIALFRHKMATLFSIWPRWELLEATVYFLQLQPVPLHDASSPLPIQEPIHRVDKDLFTTPSKSMLICGMFLPALDQIKQRSIINLDQATAAELAIAVERYRRKHGTLPESLDSLVPKFLPKIPADRLNGLPFLYESGELEVKHGNEIVRHNGYQIKYSGADADYSSRYELTVLNP